MALPLFSKKNFLPTQESMDEITKHDRTADNIRIAKNTSFLYVRMIFLMIVYLYTSRIVLKGLGISDYGTYNVVGGLVSMFSLVSATLTGACSRFLNYEMGRGNKEKLKKVFSTTLSIQWTLALLVFLLAETVGLWYVNNKMVIAENRLEAANWCFHFSLITFCINLITVPYNASVVAHERMKIFSYVGIYQGLLTLLVAKMINVVSFDKLIYYACALCAVQATVQLIYQVYCKRHFEECKFFWTFDRSLLSKMLSYSLWHFIGNGAVVLKVYGVDMVLNLFFGPVMNAAKAISNQVESAAQQFVGNFMMALNPQITQSYANGDNDYMLSLIDRGARFSFYLIMMLSVPIIINAHQVLELWLDQVPEHSVAFVRLALTATIVGALSKPLITAQNATGNVRNYQITVGMVTLLNLPLSYLCLTMGAKAEAVLVVALLVEIAALTVRILMIPATVKAFKPMFFVRNVIVRCVCVLVLSVAVPVGVILFLPENTWLSFFLSVAVCFACTTVVVLYVGCERTERVFLFNKIEQQINKIAKR